MTRCEILIKAVEVLNKAKGTNFQISNVKVSRNGSTIDCYCVFPSGWSQELGFVNGGFTNNGSTISKDGTCPLISAEANKRIPEDADDETKTIMRIMAGFGENRNL